MAKGVKNPLPPNIRRRLKEMAEEIGPPDEPGQDKTHPRAIAFLEGAVRYLLEIEDERASSPGVTLPASPDQIVKWRVQEAINKHRLVDLTPTQPDPPEVPTPPVPPGGSAPK